MTMINRIRMILNWRLRGYKPTNSFYRIDRSFPFTTRSNSSPTFRDSIKCNNSNEMMTNKVTTTAIQVETDPIKSIEDLFTSPSVQMNVLKEKEKDMRYCIFPVFDAVLIW